MRRKALAVAVVLLAVLSAGCASRIGVGKRALVAVEEKSGNAATALPTASDSFIAEEKSTPTLTVLPPAEPFIPEPFVARRDYEFVDLTGEGFQTPISATFKDTDLLDMVLDLARGMELNIVMDPTNLSGRVTLEVSDAPIGAVLHAVLSTHSLVLIRKVGGIHSIIPKPAPPSPEVITVHVPLKHVPAGEVKAMLEEFFDARIAVDPFNNALLIADEPLRIEEMATVIKRVDQAPKRRWLWFR